MNLDELKRLAALRTQGEWLHVNHGNYIELLPEDSSSYDGPICLGTLDKNAENNSMFIAAIANNIDALLAVVEAAKEYAIVGAPIYLKVN